jgi:protein-disulfide isomerase
MKTRIALALVLMTAISGSALAQDTSVLRPPKGAKVAIIAFEDLQCPDCADAEPLLQDAAATYKVAIVRHDFPLYQHAWAFEAHVIAAYLDTRSPALGEEFRHWVYENQKSINRTNLRGMAERFADEHKITLPAAIDPTGKLAARVQADYQLGQELNIQHTPTLYVVSETQRSEPFIEGADRGQLFEVIEQMKKHAESATPKAAAKPATKKTS